MIIPQTDLILSIIDADCINFVSFRQKLNGLLVDTLNTFR